MYFFFHIPKTAGSSVRQILEGWFAHTPTDRAYSAKDLQELFSHTDSVCVAGHFGGSLLRDGMSLIGDYPFIRSNPACRVFTFLRDPIEQAISTWHHRKKQGKMPLDLAEFLRSRHQYAYFRVFGCPINRQQLVSSFMHWGITEELQTSMDQLADKLELPRVEVPRINVAETKTHTEDIPASDRRRLEKLYSWEYELYEQVRDIVRNPSLHRHDPATQFQQFATSANLAAKEPEPPRLVQSDPVRSDRFEQSNEVAELMGVVLHGEDMSPRVQFAADEPVGVTVRFKLGAARSPIQPALLVRTVLGDIVCSIAYTDPDRYTRTMEPGEYSATAWLPRSLLNVGAFTIEASLSSPLPVQRFARMLEPIAFTIVEADGPSARGLWQSPFPGAVRPLVTWSTKAL